MRILFILLLLFLTLSFGYLYLNRVPLFIRAVEPRLGMKVELNDLKLSLSSLAFDKLKLSDTKNESYFEADKILIELSLSSLFLGPLTIDELLIEKGVLEYHTPPITEKTARKLLDKGLNWLVKQVKQPSQSVDQHHSKTPFLVVQSLQAKELTLRFLNPLKKGEMITLPTIPLLKMGQYEDVSSTNLRSATQALLKKLASHGNKIQNF